jgi:hypothetical protein
MASAAPLERSFVTLVADDPETLDEVQAYLRCAGIQAQASRGSSLGDDVPARATAVIWFADAIADATVVRAVSDLRRRRPGLRILVLTSLPSRLTQVLGQAMGSMAPLVLSRSALGSEILGALRCRISMAPLEA